MSLDQNLFTLVITPKDANTVDLIDPSGTVHYRKERVVGSVYTINIYDPVADSLLATATAPSATSKSKTIELHNPSVPVQFKYAGTLTFRWRFEWETHEFEWKREECYMLRKPDPPVLVALTKEPAGRIKSTSIQILDYNLNRFDIVDRKGLEIVILTALLTFHDASDDYHTESQDSPPSSSRMPSKQEATSPEPYVLSAPASAPVLPPKPPKTGAEKIAEMQNGQLNEVQVLEEGTYQEYADYCSNLLEGDNMLFITIHSSSPSTVLKVMQVVEQIKRLRHVSGEDEDLHQYVLNDSSSQKGKKPPRVINLDDDDKKDKSKKYEPPNSLSIHLSKIAMPELEPRARSKSDATAPLDNSKAKSKSKKDKKGKEKHKKAQSLERDEFLRPEHSFLSKAASSTHARTSSHQVRPYQPSPSPSQLNNPGIYLAPPPPPPPSRPKSAYGFAPSSFLDVGPDKSSASTLVTSMFDKLRSR